ncbi:MAG: biotin--[Burkholderiaceae bacterium]|nr:biotin--[acetyl-CoA-carboxylase] ligase [Burkholderiaceae bacterium]
MQLFKKTSGLKPFYCAHIDRTSSTNSDLFDWVKKTTCDIPCVLWADHQTAGRGTRGRVWKSPRQSLMFSIAISLKKTLRNYIGVTLTIGLKIVRFLRLKGINASLKWPNDILVEDRKLAGILVENVKNFDGLDTLIIGIGLNLEQADFELDQYRACAVSDFVDQDWTLELKTEWLKALVASVIDAVDEVGDVGLKMTVQEWENFAAYQNEMIDLYVDGEIVTSAIQHGIDESGRLLVSTPDGICAYLSGTISLRKK